jgi:hypothetical protein
MEGNFMRPDMAVVKVFGDPADARTLSIKLKKSGLFVEIAQAPGSPYGLGFEIEYSVLVPSDSLTKALAIVNE